jgi:hypothetical protein
MLLLSKEVELVRHLLSLEQENKLGKKCKLLYPMF